MKERVFIKKNVFTCVMFGAIFLFVLFESTYASSNLSVIAFIVAIPIFILSVIKIGINVLEDLNNKITSFLRRTEHREQPSWEDLGKIRKSQKNISQEQIRDMSNEYPNSDYIFEILTQYASARKTRETIRFFRRGLLYIYYLIFMIIFLLLLLHTEIYAYLNSNPSFLSINMDLFTVWSLIIILLEIMMKDIIEDIIEYIVEKNLGINLKYY